MLLQHGSVEGGGIREIHVVLQLLLMLFFLILGGQLWIFSAEEGPKRYLSFYPRYRIRVRRAFCIYDPVDFLPACVYTKFNKHGDIIIEII